MAEIINGKEIAKEIREEVRRAVLDLKDRTGNIPGLAVVLVGEDPASEVYVRMKEKACQKAGITSFQHRLPFETGQDELLNLIERLNRDPRVNGILVQLPLPDQIDEGKIINAIDTRKGCGRISSRQCGQTDAGRRRILPALPGIMELLQRSGTRTGRNMW